MRRLTLLFASALALVSLSISNTVLTKEKNSTEARSALEQYNLDDTKIALRGYSPVSYFEKGRPERGKKQFKATNRGINYYFTSDAQRRKFERNPDKYEPAFGGWCAFGMTVEGRFRADPEKWKIVKDKLLVFLNDVEVDARVLWENGGDDEELTRKAAAFWQRVSGENFASL